MRQALASTPRAQLAPSARAFVRAAAGRSPVFKCQAHRSASPAPAPMEKPQSSRVACNATLTASFPVAKAAAAADPLVELQRLVLQAQEEKELWARQLALHEQQEQQVRAQLDATARRQAHSRVALTSLCQLLAAARQAAREQHLAVFSESVFMCGRQRSIDPEEDRQALACTSRDAAEQLQHYEQTLTRMVGAVVASMAASEGSLPSLPSLPSLGGLVPVEQLPLVVVAPASGPRNNIVPRKGSKGKVTLLQLRKPRAALHAQ